MEAEGNTVTSQAQGLGPGPQACGRAGVSGLGTYTRVAQEPGRSPRLRWRRCCRNVP